jgi:hypothetical protein
MEFRKKLFHNVVSSMYEMKDSISERPEEDMIPSEWDLSGKTQEAVVEEEEEGAVTTEDKDLIDTS